MMTASTLIGRYEVIRELGRGAMGTVFLARDTALGRMVALKTFRASFADGADGADPEDSGILRRRSLREAQRAGTLSHPSVITIFDVVEVPDEDSFHIVMEYVEGQGLDARMRERGPMQLAEVAPIVAQIASALDHLHARGIVHRDVKPGNVLVTGDGRVKITDFGIARSEDPGATLDTDVYGTPYYMAPEQIQGRPVDARTDVFALGVVVYEMLTGARPFPGSTVAEVAHRIVYGVPAEPEVDGKPLSAAVREVLQKALAKNPDERFPTAGALANAVQDLAEATGNLDLDATTAFPRKRWLATVPASRRATLRTPLLIAVVAAVVVLLLSGWFFYVRALNPATPTPIADELQARRVSYIKLMSEAKQLLAKGDAEGAVLIFQAAEGMALDPTAARRLREEAQRKAEEQGAHLQLLDARDDLAKGRYDQVVATARKMMATQAGREKAAGVLADVEEALARSERTPRAAPPAGPRPQPATAGTDGAAAVEPEPEPASTAINFGLLHVDLTSDAPEGQLTLWVDGKMMRSQAFEFYERTGVFRRRRPAVPGKLPLDVTLWEGKHSLRLLLARPGQPGAVKEIAATILPGAMHTLAISLPARGTPAVEFALSETLR